MKMKEKLSLLWIFLILNFLYCDVVTLMDSEALNELISGKAGDLEITQGFLLAASIYMEIPILMILLSRKLAYKTNRWANIIAGVIVIIFHTMSLFVGTPTMYYAFFSAIELSTLAYIVWNAWKWREEK